MRLYTIHLLFGLALRNKRLAVARANSHVGKDLLRSELDGGGVCGLVGDLLLQFLQKSEMLTHGSETYQVVVDTLVELPLGRAALPQLMISVVQALPVFAELGKAVGVEVLDASGVSDV